MAICGQKLSGQPLNGCSAGLEILQARNSMKFHQALFCGRGKPIMQPPESCENGRFLPFLPITKVFSDLEVILYHV